MTIFLLLALFLFNFKVLLGSYYFNYANSKYIEKNYSGAINYYDKSMKYMSGSQIDFNKGNAFYRIGEIQDDINKKIQYYSKSLNQYSSILDTEKAMNNGEDPDVRYNYNFVKNKLEELQKQQEEQEKEEKQNNNQNQDNQGEQQKQDSQDENEEKNSKEDKKSGNDSDEKQDPQNGESKDDLQGDQSSEVDESGQIKSGGQQKELDLTPEEMQQVEQYVQSLKNEEKYNREYYNNIKPEQSDPFFDSVFDRGSDKDR